MCLVLYIATDQEIPEQALGLLTVRAIDDDMQAKLSPSFKRHGF